MVFSEHQPGEARSEDRVEINTAYLVYLHDMLAESVQKVEQMFGGSANQVLVRAESEQVARALVEKGVIEPSLGGAIQALRRWGMRVSPKWQDHTLELEVVCPYAKTVHPKLSTENPVCPLGVVIGGAARKEDSKAIVKETVNGSGVVFSIRWDPHRAL